MVEFTHQAVDVGRCIPTNVGDKQSNELWRDVVKHGAMDTDLLQDVPWKAITRAKDKSEAPVLISISWILDSITQGYLPPQGREAIVKKKKTNRRKDVWSWSALCLQLSDTFPQKGKKSFKFGIAAIKIWALPLHDTIGLYHSPSYSLLSSHMAIFFHLAKHVPNSGLLHQHLENSFLHLHVAGSTPSGISWNAIALSPFPSLR